MLTQTVLPLLATQLARLSVLLDDGVVRLQEYWELLNATTTRVLPLDGYAYVPAIRVDPAV